MMKLENVDKYYNINTSSEVHALKNINLSIEKGEMVAIMGVWLRQVNAYTYPRLS